MNLERIKTRCYVSLFLILWVLILPAPSAPAQPPLGIPLQEVRLQLKWVHAFQFAGYYAAREKGFYSEEGLAVTISPGVPERPCLDVVVSGQAEYGAVGGDLLVSRLAGKPVVVLAVIFQHSPSVILTRKDNGIRSPSDLVGRRVMLGIEEIDKGEFWAMLKSEGIAKDSIQVVPHSWNLSDLVEGRVDASMDYVTDEPHRMQMLGVEPGIIQPITYGIDFYGDFLFTTEGEIKKHPERAAAFRRASLRGWEYAMSHVEEMIPLILDLPGVRDRGVTADHLRYEAEQMRKLILPELVEVGHINPGRWNRMAETFVDLDMISPGFDLDGFIYQPNSPKDNHWGAIILAFLGSIGFAFLVERIWNRQLRQAVKAQTKELRENEQRFRGFTETINDWVWEMDTRGAFTYSSPKVLDLLGYTPEEVVGRLFWTFMSPLETENVAALFEEYLMNP
ncbi:MAG: ABC transporter substrate-binding protein, partial [Desulfatibacillum sp.]|nr:ABC transporter substrate-binding protein [Desulfatibacillum sp.]